MEKSAFYRESRHDVSGPLTGVRVLEATTTLAGPMCGCMLADMGADVIKVESPEGEVSRRLPPFLTATPGRVGFMHATVNRNKRSLTLDLERPEGRDIFLALARKSDIVVENFRPGIMANWGVGYNDVRAVKPDIVYVSISGFGQFGPEHERAGYDPIAQAESGFMSLNGSPEGPPVKAATLLCDDLAGLHGAIAALGALHHRNRTAEGQHVDVALLDAMLFQSDGFLSFGALGLELRRNGNEYPFAAPANVYRCRDGFVQAGALLDSHWRLLARKIGRPELGEDPRYATGAERVKRRAELNRLVDEWTATRDVEEVVRSLASEGLAAGPVRTYAETARDRHVQVRDMLQNVVQEDGKSAPITGPAAKFSRTPVRIRSAAPALGAHNAEILDELGIDVATQKHLRESRII